MKIITFGLPPNAEKDMELMRRATGLKDSTLASMAFQLLSKHMEAMSEGKQVVVFDPISGNLSEIRLECQLLKPYLAEL